MVTLIGEALWYAGFATNANWVQANSQFRGALPIKGMITTGAGVAVADGNGDFFHCDLPGGEWLRDIPKLPSSYTFKQFMG